MHEFHKTNSVQVHSLRSLRKLTCLNWGMTYKRSEKVKDNLSKWKLLCEVSEPQYKVRKHEMGRGSKKSHWLEAWTIQWPKLWQKACTDWLPRLWQSTARILIELLLCVQEIYCVMIWLEIVVDHLYLFSNIYFELLQDQTHCFYLIYNWHKQIPCF